MVCFKNIYINFDKLTVDIMSFRLGNKPIQPNVPLHFFYKQHVKNADCAILVELKSLNYDLAPI